MTKHNDKERALFEAAYSGEYGTPVSVLKLLRDGDAYIEKPSHSDRLNSSWWMWKQARAQLPAGGAVPDAIPMQPYQTVDRGSVNFKAGWNACRKAMLAAAPHPVSGEQIPPKLDDSQFVDEFMKWWEDHGQYVRSGGGDYERTFAFQAWRHLMPSVLAYRAISAPPAAQDVAGLVEALNVATGRWASLAADSRFSEAEHRREQPELNKALAVLDVHRAQQGEQTS